MYEFMAVFSKSFLSFGEKVRAGAVSIISPTAKFLRAKTPRPLEEVFFSSIG